MRVAALWSCLEKPQKDPGFRDLFPRMMRKQGLTGEATDSPNWSNSVKRIPLPRAVCSLPPAISLLLATHVSLGIGVGWSWLPGLRQGCSKESLKMQTSPSPHYRWPLAISVNPRPLVSHLLLPPS